MRLFLLRIVLTVVLVTGSAAPSLALGWEWLDHLSGPGPWFGVQYEQKLACWFEDQDSKKGSVVGVGGSGPCLTSNRAKGQKKEWDKRIFAAGIGTHLSWTKENDLPYPANTDDGDKRVYLFQLNAFADVRLPRHLKALHLGAALGAAHFWGTLVEDALWRPTIEARASLKLFKITDTSSLDLRIGRRWFLGELSAANFGAAGPFRVQNDGVWFAGMIFDFN